MALLKNHRPSMASRIASAFLLLLLAVGIIIVGAKSGYTELAALGLVLALIDVIAIVILVIINVCRNRHRW
jgi:membrane protein YdbS with pleckstrin-like domain